jgi:hypothetical protein
MALRYTYTINFLFFFHPPPILRYIYIKSGQNLANIRYMHFIRYKSVINISIITKILQCVDTSLKIVIPILEPIKIKITSFVPVTVHVQLAMVQ